MKVSTQSAKVEREFEFSPNDFTRIRQLIHQHAGIYLSDTKADMVYCRFGRHLRSRGLKSFKQYLDYLEHVNDPTEWQFFINALTTNLTSFFRENHHFPILAELMSRAKRPLRIWCAAASSGEEPYSIAMTACETFGSLTPPVEIIASDIDTTVLAVAEKGIYSNERITKLSEERRKLFFLKGKGSQLGSVKVRPELKELVTFQPLSLLATSWPHKQPFDAIFCRNVMIYFDRPNQVKVLNKFAQLLKPEGLLFAGHSENFTFITDRFKLRGKTVYELSNAPVSHARAISTGVNRK